MSRLKLIALMAVTVLAGTVVASTHSAAATASPAPAGAVGHDVSYPQCSGSSSTVGGLGGQFGIVGVTNGLPWSTNPCLANEYAWASGLANEPALYANTANPAPRSSFYWPASGASDPALCKDSTSTSDAGCAYDYGWHAAANAMSIASSTIGPVASTLTWWLDVESANSWNGTTTANAADLQGAIDYLRSQGVPAVGLYSTAANWNTITGGYTVSTSAAYESAWSAEFTPASPMRQSRTWVAGAGTSSSAATVCTSAAFTGPTPQLAQYRDGTGFDADLACGAPTAAQSVRVSVSPNSGTVKPGGTKTTTVTVTEQGASQPVNLSATTSSPGPAVSLSRTSLSGPGTASLTVKAAALRSGTYIVTVTATGATTGTSSATYALNVRGK